MEVDTGDQGSTGNSAEVIRDLFVEVREDLMRFLAFRVRNRAESEELAQEAYLRMLKLDQIHLIRNPRAYLFRVAANVLADSGRIRKRRILTEDFRDGSVDPPDRRADPFERAMWRQRMELVAGAVDELPENCRRALILHRRDGWTYNEIAEELGVSSSMVKKYLRKALVLCRRALAEEEVQ